MLKGLYTAASAMITQQRRTEMLTNNIANANTPGYKEDQGSIRAFPEMLLSRMESDSFQTDSGSHSFTKQTPIGALNTGVYMQELTPLFSQGDLQSTNEPTNIAISEKEVPVNQQTNDKAALFYAVRLGSGDIRYSRSSNFSLNENNELTINGNVVLSTDGRPIAVDSENFKVAEDGTVSENGRNLGTIDVRISLDTRNLAKEGNDLYRTENGQELPSAAANPAVSYSIKQGMTERSNVDVTRDYTEMTAAYRSFEANQKVLQAYDKSMDRAANDIGKIV
ncbi:flagellar basal body rod protein FlgC [Bacillus glycinifermentans]|uniref:Flagellar biosynthesis protein FlgC n=1 Tax=Bacillus glycinifermentans TaxID=1664069 RepID=A0A0J6EM53_9BACI|nr:flagellar hook-basal body protein [Bacillus glycinifermentans]ATH93521.1 flagellar hook-basal body protein [Bacillus glycinifermentans]KMM56850.1 flagellar basal body rod protein FlgC [Bacillus glycinifermentans]KRT90313.1 flagellar biosynthesis protein FlgC [Bacillus glycinifermentans]MEC0484008.1 flagellar hook-basal body protein [Bacillus glycinifermentans]MEC0492873.1 flagellar hook-basal body protein [Bacillus glycinifermentans]